MTNMDKLVALGRFMIRTAPGFAEDARFNAWARVGQLLTEVGTPFGKKLAEFEAEDMAVVREGAQVLVGRMVMPELMAPKVLDEGRRTRRARMTQVMRKPAKVKAATKPKSMTKPSPRVSTAVNTAATAVKRGRGRPRKVMS